jgi:UDP-N-acetylglucosamine 1-carboxyvinyltransferase
VRVAGAKNSVLKLMAATTLASGRFTLRNVPAISDVGWMCDLLTAMGARCERPAPHEVVVVSPDSHAPVAPYELVERMRASIVVLGPLVARFGEARVALPGGDDFGPRPVDMHLRVRSSPGPTV